MVKTEDGKWAATSYQYALAILVSSSAFPFLLHLTVCRYSFCILDEDALPLCTGTFLYKSKK